jgi:hypothetical protein
MEVTKAEFARLKGWNRSTVTRYAEANKIVLTAAGLVDVEASEHRLAAAADPYKDGVRMRHQRERQHKGVHGSQVASGTGGEEYGPRIDPNDTSYQTLQKARAAAETERATLLRIEREEKEGLVCDAEAVRKASFNTSRPAMSAIMNMRFRIDPLLMVETDAAKRSEIWDRELRAVCDEIIRASDAAIAELIGK